MAVKQDILDIYAKEVEGIKEAGLFKGEAPIASPQGARVKLEDGREVINMCANNYLGLGDDKRLIEAAKKTYDEKGYGLASVRFICGTQDIHKQLEKRISSFLGMDDTILYSSCFDANGGLFETILTAEDAVISDELNHASIIDGIRLSTARCIRFRHNDLVQLERLLEQHHTTYRQLIIVTESIFSMDGDQADLTALVRLKKRYSNVLLYVDEAHAFGVRGLRGLGCAEETGCIRDIDFLVGTFGKAAASAGAYIACCRTIREYLVNRMRTLIFTTALPPTSIAWTLFIVRKLAGMQDRREHLARISRTLREALQAKGYGCPSASHIVPLIIGPSADTVLCAELLQRHGFYALPVRPPTVPEGTSRIRFSLTADIREDEIGELIPLIPLKEERNTNAIRF